MHLNRATDDAFRDLVDLFQLCVSVSLWLFHLCPPLSPCRLDKQPERRFALFARYQRKRAQDVFELRGGELIQLRDARVQAGERCGVGSSRQQARERGDLTHALGAISGVGIGSCSTVAVVTCVVTRRRTR